MKISNFITLFFLLALLSIACKTDDIEPIFRVSLSSSANSVIENEGTLEIIATLSEVTDKEVLVNLFYGAKAINGVDYMLSNEVISISPNSLTGSITLTAIQDTLVEYNEAIEISITSIEGATFKEGEKITLSVEDDDVPFIANIIVNEILYDPPNTGLDGDANGDGVNSVSEDEFIEFINLSSQDIDISGYRIYDSVGIATETPRHIVSSGTILPAGAVWLVFGGGSPSGSFGGALVQTSSTGNLSLSNAGDVMTLIDAVGFQIARFDIEPLSNNPNESYTRNPDINGDFEQHNDNTLILFSPGTKIDGTNF